jgi:hypothetical protein
LPLISIEGENTKEKLFDCPFLAGELKVKLLVLKCPTGCVVLTDVAGTGPALALLLILSVACRGTQVF